MGAAGAVAVASPVPATGSGKATPATQHFPSSSFLPPAPAPPAPPPLAPLAPTITVTILPRTQTETWSAYWKESMRTLTKACAPVTLTAAPGDGLAGVLARVGAAVGWPGVEGLDR